MKLINLLLLGFFISLQICLAQNRDNAEFTVWIKNNPDEKEICIYYTGIGFRWDNNGNLTNSYAGGTTDCPVAVPGDTRRDFYYITSVQSPTFGRGLYFFEARDASNNRLQQLYIDWRTTGIPVPSGTPDIDFDYDVGNNYFKYNNSYIQNESYFGAWELNDYIAHSINGLSDYWQNCLALIKIGEYPKLVWGPHPNFNTTHFKIYRSIPGTSKYATIATVDNKTFDYNDWNTFYWNTDGIKYYVKAYNGSTYSARTNIVNTPQYKMSKTEENQIIDNSYSFGLEQNFPNPFNPSTRITYQIPSNGYVLLKIYNTLGKEVAELVNETKEKGTYAVTFNADNLPSGMYFYKITVSDPSTSSGQGFTDVKKMLLIK